MHRFEVRGNVYAFDEQTLFCLSPDALASKGLELWEGLGRDPNMTQIREQLGCDFPQAEVDEFVSELETLCTMMSEDAVEEPEIRRTLRTIDLHVAHSCNLACQYCFAGQGDYGVQRSLMTDDVAFRAVDMLVESAADNERLGVVFFGGEPLMNFPLIERTVAYIKEHHDPDRFDYSTTTNGTLLDDERADFLVENKFNVLISMDGVGTVQDSLRPYKNGKGTSADIEERIKRLSERLPVGVRATVTSQNLDLETSCAAFCGVGFSRVHYAPVSTEDPALRLDSDDVQTFFDEYIKLSDGCLHSFRSKQRNAFGGFDRLLHQLKTRTRVVHGCGAGKRLLAVTPEGDLYPCHRFVGSEAWKMGTVWGGISAEMSEFFWSFEASQRDDCRECWALHLCGGGCVHDACKDDGTTGRVDDPMLCEVSRHAAMVAIDLYSRVEKERDAMKASVADDRRPGHGDGACAQCQ